MVFQHYPDYSSYYRGPLEGNLAGETEMKNFLKEDPLSLIQNTATGKQVTSEREITTTTACLLENSQVLENKRLGE